MLKVVKQFNQGTSFLILLCNFKIMTSANINSIKVLT